MPLLFYSGERARASKMNELTNKDSVLPLGIISRGNRTTSSSTTTTEGGVLRQDDIPMYLGRTYKIWTTPLLMDTSVAADVASSNLRITTDGSTPSTSSTILSSVQAPLANATSGNTVPHAIDYTPTVDVLFSVLLTVTRVSGTGNISLVGAATAPINLVVEDCGLDKTDTGTDI